MNRTRNNEGIGETGRRRFLAAAGATALAAIAVPAATPETTGRTGNDMQGESLTGNGEWTCRIRSDWGKLPVGTAFGGTHGAIAQDNAGHIYVSTQSATGVSGVRS